MNRLDKEVHSRGLAKSRAAAVKLISNGNVAVNGEVCCKPSDFVTEDDVIEVSGELPDTLRYASQGGFKLEYALDTFGFNLNRLVCLDIGASTGGFTDCMLKRGAVRVYSVEVGTDQLAPSLREDKRVISFERLDIRNADNSHIPEKVDFVTVDVSFISLKLILPKLTQFLKSGGKAVVLIKPQFELGKQIADKYDGVITDRDLQNRAVDYAVEYARDSGFIVKTTQKHGKDSTVLDNLDYTEKAIVESPIIGRRGNAEFLMGLEYISLI